MSYYTPSGNPVSNSRGLSVDVRNEFSAIGSGFTQVESALNNLETIGIGSYSTTSTTSLTIGTGSKSLTVETGKSFVIGQPVMIASTVSPTNYMVGQVTTYNSGTGAMTVNVTTTNGSGTVAAWTVAVSAIYSPAQKRTQYQVFTANGTWVQPSDVTAEDTIKVLLISGGGGGGSGGASVLQAAAAQYGAGAAGGGGGGSGFAIVLDVLLGTAPGTSHNVVVGAGGNGAAAVTASGNSVSGNPGATGGSSSFGAYSFAVVGGGGGGGGGISSRLYGGNNVFYTSSAYGGAGGAYGTGVAPYTVSGISGILDGATLLASEYFYESVVGAMNGHGQRTRPIGSSIGEGGYYQQINSSNAVSTVYDNAVRQEKTKAYNFEGTTFFGVSLSRNGGLSSSGGHISRDAGSVLNQNGNITGTATAGANATGYGSGGQGGRGCVNGGGSATSGAGGNGSPGVVVVVWESAQ